MCPTRIHFESLKIAYTAIFFESRNFAYTAKFRDEICPTRANFENSVLNSDEFKIWFRSEILRVEMCPTRTHFEALTRASDSRILRVKFALTKFVLARAARNVPYTGTFQLQMKQCFIFEAFARECFKFWLQNFWNIDEIEAELVQQWCSISSTLLKFRIFRNWMP